jgi:hypothetical protein
MPLTCLCKLARRHTGRQRKRDNLTTGEGEWVGEEPNHRMARKAWYSIKNSIIFSFKYLLLKSCIICGIKLMYRTLSPTHRLSKRICKLTFNASISKNVFKRFHVNFNSVSAVGSRGETVKGSEQQERRSLEKVTNVRFWAGPWRSKFICRWNIQYFREKSYFRFRSECAKK